MAEIPSMCVVWKIGKTAALPVQVLISDDVSRSVATPADCTVDMLHESCQPINTYRLLRPLLHGSLGKWQSLLRCQERMPYNNRDIVF